MLSYFRRDIDWILFFSVLPLLSFGLITLYSFLGENAFFEKQVLWIGIALGVFFVLSTFDYRFLRRTEVVLALYLAGSGMLLLLFLIGSVFQGAQSWFNFGGFAVQPSDPMKLVVILILAKYFSRRHVEIGNIRHIIVSGLYVFVPFLLVFLQPDFGSALIIFFIWFGMILVSGISKQHLFLVFFIAVGSFFGLWNFVFEEYQKDRIMTFLHPLADIQGAGYNAFQSTVAIGSGQIFGKGLGYGTQSRLSFLPEYQTDFIFAAFTEEWGFIGALFVFFFFGVLVIRILMNAVRGETNFETLFGCGLAIYFMSHFIVNIGMNIGLLPVTGITLPFISYGGSHLITEFAGLGILMGMRRYSHATLREGAENEIQGVDI